jgi:hypothetical protein
MNESDVRQPTYRVTSTSRQSAIVERQFLTLGDEDDRLTRWYDDPTQVEYTRSPEVTVKVSIGHERRARAGRPWIEEPRLTLATVPAGRQVPINLNSIETLALYQHLTRLYEVARSGVQRGEHVLMVWDAGMPIAVGTARDWTVKDTGGNQVPLAEIRSKYLASKPVAPGS